MTRYLSVRYLGATLLSHEVDDDMGLVYDRKVILETQISHAHLSLFKIHACNV